MAIVKFPRKEFEKYVRITPTIEEKIAMFGTPLKALDENEIAIEIFPNRPDLLSFQGYLRAFLTFIGKKRGLATFNVNKPEKDYEIFIHKSVGSVRPYTACAIIKNLKFDNKKIKEIIDLQEKIHATLGRNRKKIAIGIYPLEKIKLPIRYEARKPQDIKFIPLGSKKEMNGLEIIKEHPTGKEYGHLLESFRRWPVFVDANNEILSMPPIINSEKTGKITEQTKDVFVECTGFNFDILKKTLNILVTTLADMNGKIYQMKLNYRKWELTPNLEPQKVKINIEAINKLLGLQLKEKNIKELLEKMGLGYERIGSEVFALVPAWRTDILHEVDVAEDVAIAYGYDKFEEEIPQIATIGKEDKKERIKKKIAEILVGLGFLETSSYHLLVKDELKKIKERIIEVEKSKTEYSILRPNLLYSILKILGKNTDAGYPQKIFEIGKVFIRDDEETGVKETEHLCLAITPGNFTEIKQVLDYFFKVLNLKHELEEATAANYIEGRTAKIIVGKELGVMGEIHPSTLCDWHLKMPAACCEIDLDALIALIEKSDISTIKSAI